MLLAKKKIVLICDQHPYSLFFTVTVVAINIYTSFQPFG
jgi:hypothetical protein